MIKIELMGSGEVLEFKDVAHAEARLIWYGIECSDGFVNVLKRDGGPYPTIVFATNLPCIAENV